MSKANEPAFPASRRNWIGDSYNSSFESITSGGLTKREYFVAMAMQGVLASGGFSTQPHWAFLTAEAAFTVADEIIKRIEKEPK